MKREISPQVAGCGFTTEKYANVNQVTAMRWHLLLHLVLY